jgi:hypothetical protein
MNLSDISTGDLYRMLTCSLATPVTVAIHAVLTSRDEQPAVITCMTCSAQITPDKRCMCWVNFADSMEKHLGYDYDHAADIALNMWDSLSEDDKARVWSNVYDNDAIHTYDDSDYADLLDGTVGEPVEPDPG